MNRRKLTVFLAGAAALLAVACRDSLVAPVRSEKSFDASQPELRRSSANANTLHGSFVLSPSGGDYVLGDFRLHVPAGVLCSPSSSYGRAHWDESCTPSRRPIRLNVELTEADGRLWIDFTPSLRFAPSDDPAKWVTVSTTRPANELDAAVQRGSIRSYALLYARTIGAIPVDEASDDPSMVTHIDLSTGEVWRRIKHFSGYTISAGFVCDPSLSASCGTTGDVDVIPNGQTTTTSTTPTPTSTTP